MFIRYPKLKSMSKIAEFADRVMEFVSHETDIPKEQILSKCRTVEIVDARHLVIKLLHSNNVYPSRIASIFNLSPRTIHYIITTFDTRAQANKTLRNNFAKIAKQLADNSEITSFVLMC